MFSSDLPIDAYRVCAAIVKSVDTLLRADDNLDTRERNNLPFYVAMHLAAVATGKRAPTAAQLAALNIDALNDAVVKASLDAVKGSYAKLGGGDHVAKGTALIGVVRSDLEAMIT